MFFKRLKIKGLTKKLKSMHQHRTYNQPKDEVLAKEIGYYHELAAIYHSLVGNKSHPYAAVLEEACLREAASLEDTKAQYALGSKLLEEAKFREQMQKNALFASTSNAERVQLLYNDALAYLKAAEKLGHIQAKRLHGLCYINGWGVENDKDKGFELVCASIEQENSWDKVPEIFAAIGLNKPEFFSAIMQRRKKS
ncbi:MAG: hypothetical protein WC785_01325 [Tatlockia sp.]|jgi:TPR repeat protein